MSPVERANAAIRRQRIAASRRYHARLRLFRLERRVERAMHQDDSGQAMYEAFIVYETERRALENGLIG